MHANGIVADFRGSVESLENVTGRWPTGEKRTRCSAASPTFMMFLASSYAVWPLLPEVDTDVLLPRSHRTQRFVHAIGAPRGLDCSRTRAMNAQKPSSGVEAMGASATASCSPFWKWRGKVAEPDYPVSGYLWISLHADPAVHWDQSGSNGMGFAVGAIA